MKLNLHARDAVVVCECGASMRVGCAGLEKYIACRNCGRRLNINDKNTHSLEDHNKNALVAFAEKKDPEYRHRLAIRLVRENKFNDALDLYESIIREGLKDRDVYYGLGYCLYRMDRADEGMAHLSTAHEMGHKSAMRLIMKIRQNHTVSH